MEYWATRRATSRCAHAAAHIGARTKISQSRVGVPPNGKPPGGDPAAPVRRRSCRGAGSATAGARLMWGLQALFARVLQISRAVHATRAPIAHSAALASAELAFGASAEPAVCTSQAVEHRQSSLLALVMTLVQGVGGVRQLLQCRTRVREGCGALPQA